MKKKITAAILAAVMLVPGTVLADETVQSADWTEKHRTDYI